MARATGKRSSKPRGGDVPSDNEIDEFHSNREKVLFEKAGKYAPNTAESESEEDEEVMGLVDDDNEDEEEEEDEDEDEEEEEEEGEEDEEVEGWGGRKNYYGGDEIEDAESAKQMAEEAIKQQKKNLEELGIEDYIDDDMMDDWDQKAESFDKETNKTSLVINEQNTDLDKLDKSEKLELLTQSFPEFIPLLKELNSLKPRLENLETNGSGEVTQVKKTALSAYLGSISSYFSLFIDQVKSGETFASMKDHPVMETILTTRQIWKEADGLAEVESEDEDEFMDAQEPEDVSGEEVSQQESDLDTESGSEQSESEMESSDDDMDIDVTAKRHIKGKKASAVGDYVEAETLDDVDAEDKKKRKKSLRFYTSKIDQAQGKNTNNSEAFAGDLDLPYKERLFERKQRLLEEARKRGQSGEGEDLDNEDYAPEEQELAQDVNDGDDSAYYEALKNSKQSKKEARKKAHKTAVQLAKEGKLMSSQELADAEGKRALNYQIMKNKGLTAHKRKEVRNARVKKRNKYEQAKKKLKSVRQVYDANNRGPYQGEKTGIKKGISRSVKLA